MALRLPASVVAWLLVASPCFGQRLPGNARTLAEVKQFFAARRIPEAERTLQQTAERISACSALAAQQSSKLAE